MTLPVIVTEPPSMYIIVNGSEITVNGSLYLIAVGLDLWVILKTQVQL